MSMTVLFTCVLIFLARVTDMTLDTVRTAAIVQGRRYFAAILGFFEALVYICAVAKVLLNLDHRVYVVAYALGFGAGTYLGIVIEQRLAFGAQLVSLFTRAGANLATALRQAGFRLTELRGQGRDGEVSVLYIEVPRRQTRQLLRKVWELDAAAFCIVNDVRPVTADAPTVPSVQESQGLDRGKPAP
ncbi:MAG: DUF5698 domain-containing protein [Tepidisphaeraceae bacterium]|jgi:uncharacterized protein YebE (UPF0316 family)